MVFLRMTETDCTESRPLGRPSDYAPEICAEICGKIAEGMTIREIGALENMPAPSTIFLWLSKHAEFSEQYARAKESQADYMADEILEIADDGTNDWYERQLRDGKTETVVDSEHINRSRLRVDTRKWLMSKMMPKKYGDKVQVGGDPTGAPLKMEVSWAPRQPGS